mmetsp:Transcript_54448/g.143826  ORF Transcript_54448/g.143826 Transcript_54448/m.143826 type:complete len:272 (-) Transcript_54448:1601-2416(-)
MRTLKASSSLRMLRMRSLRLSPVGGGGVSYTDRPSMGLGKITLSRTSRAVRILGSASSGRFPSPRLDPPPPPSSSPALSAVSASRGAIFWWTSSTPHFSFSLPSEPSISSWPTRPTKPCSAAPRLTRSDVVSGCTWSPGCSTHSTLAVYTKSQCWPRRHSLILGVIWSRILRARSLGPKALSMFSRVSRGSTGRPCASLVGRRSPVIRKPLGGKYWGLVMTRTQTFLNRSGSDEVRKPARWPTAPRRSMSGPSRSTWIGSPSPAKSLHTSA